MKSHIVTKISRGPLPPIFIISCFIIFLVTNTPIGIGLAFLGIILLCWVIIYNIFKEEQIGQQKQDKNIENNKK